MRGVTWRSARAVSSGKPTTTPSATTTSGSRSRLAGRAWRNTSNSSSPSVPAMVARATVRNTGSKPCTAMRVAGSEPLKINTPTMPLTQPFVVLSIERVHAH